ncbi:MAG: transcriptional antiterminator, Rof [Sulfuricella sp.]|nr:transcriptional antiterminator, Rof [Sulfuricella sp.]
MKETYQPIPCIQHERLEFSILRRLHLELEYLENGVRKIEVVSPLDVNTREAGEWLKFGRRNGKVVEIRLDTILAFKEVFPLK